jgi:hypothetical protein
MIRVSASGGAVAGESGRVWRALMAVAAVAAGLAAWRINRGLGLV